HAKNYSLVYKADGIHLSKFYDVNNAAAFREHYKQQRPRLAMFVGGDRDPTELTREHWSRFAKEVSVGSNLVHEELSNMAARIADAVKLVRQRAKGTVADTRLLDLVVADVSE